MPDFQYYSTFGESIGILHDLCEQGFQIVAESGPLDEPSAPIFSSITDELENLLRLAPSYYLAGTFTRFPVQFFHFESGPSAGKYGINILTQGPLMQSMVGRVNNVDGRQTLLPGDTGYQPQYENPETGEWEKPTSELKSAYRKVVSTIKKRCVRYNAGIEIYIGPEALELFKSGETHIADQRIANFSSIREK